MKKLSSAVCLLFLLILGFQSVFFSFAVSNGSKASEKAESITISSRTIVISVGETAELKINGTSQKVKWETDGKGVAAVNKNGRVIGVRQGVGLVTAKVGSKKLACAVRVEKPALSRTAKTFYIGEAYSLKLKNTLRYVRWISTDSSVVTVGKNGKLNAVSTGKAKIVAAVGKAFYTCAVEVREYRTIKNVPYINQNEVGLPTGCESVSAVMALKYLGVNISTDKFVDKYLSRSEMMFVFNPYKEFGGDPRSEKEGMGCYNTAIEKAVKKLIKDKKLKLKVTALSGVSVDKLCKTYVNNNIPVVFWATSGMKKPRKTCEIYYNGKKHRWIAPCHCLLLVGCDGENYIFHDPQTEAYRKYPKAAVERAYKGMKSQALVITKK